MTDDTETRPFPDTAMGAAFERALTKSAVESEPRRGANVAQAETGMSKQLRNLPREDALSLLIEENRRFRVEVGQLKSTIQAQGKIIEDLGFRAERLRQQRDSFRDELTQAKERVARYNRMREPSAEVRVFGFTFPDSDKPLPNHFGRSMRHAKHYAMTDDPTFRTSHDEDLELVECLVRIPPGAKRVRVRAFDRKPHATDEPEKAEAAS